MALDWEDLTGSPSRLDPAMLPGKDDLKKATDWARLMLDRAAMGAMMLPEGGYEDWRGKVEEGTGLTEALTGKTLDRPPSWEQTLGTVAPGYQKYIKGPADTARREQPVLAAGEHALDATQLASMMLLLPGLSRAKRALASSDWRKAIVPEMVDLEATSAVDYGKYWRARDQLARGEIPRERGLSPEGLQAVERLPMMGAQRADRENQVIAPWVVGTRDMDPTSEGIALGNFDLEGLTPEMRQLIAGFSAQRMKGNPNPESFADTLRRFRAGGLEAVPRFSGEPVGIGNIGWDPEKIGAALGNVAHRLHISNDPIPGISSAPYATGLSVGSRSAAEASSNALKYPATEGARVFMPQDAQMVSLNNRSHIRLGPRELAISGLHEGLGHGLANMAYLNDPHAIVQALPPDVLANMYEDAWLSSFNSRQPMWRDTANKLASDNPTMREYGKGQRNYLNSLSEVTGEASVPVVQDFKEARKEMPVWAEFFRDAVTQAPEVKDRYKWLVGLLAPYIASQEAMNPANQEQPAP